MPLFLNNIDLNSNELQNAVIQNLASDPASGAEVGKVYYNTTSNEIRVYNGTLWEAVGLNGVTADAAEVNILDGATLTTVELNYVDGVTSAIQTQLDAKAPLASPTFTGTVAGITSTMVGLGNVDNTSNATERAATATLTNKTLTSPVINTPTGIVKGDVGLGNVDNTADTAKPVSTAQQTALDLKSNLDSPTFTGTPTLPTGTIATTQTAGNNTTAVATTAFVSTAVANLVDVAPEALNTLNELAAALGDDANFATTTATNLGLKAPLDSPTFTGTPTLPTGTIATTQAASNNSTAVATTAYVDAADLLKANLASPTFTGTPTLPTGTIAVTQDASNNSTAVATTAYVDAAVISAAGSGLEKVSASVGDGVATTYTVTHSLGTRDVLVQVTRVASPYDVVIADVAAATESTVTVTFATAPTSNQYRVVVIG